MSARTDFAALRTVQIARAQGVVLPSEGMSLDERLLQKALLEPRNAAPLPLLQRIAGAVWRWL